jgi:mRNA-degrading endonuclease toxin of MazEF toxin-antitoxin module
LNLGDVHWVELPDRGGREQSGRRPAIIWQDSAAFPQLPTMLIIPLSSQQGALRFGGTALIHPSPGNGLSLPSVALVFQLGACDVRRIGQRLGRLSDHDLVAIRTISRKLQGLDQA